MPKQFASDEDRRAWYRGYYSQHHARPRPTIIERFWSRVERRDGCWGWGGGTLSNGYTQLEDRSNGKRRVVLGHRLSYEIHHGPIPDGLFVCHHCDNPSCTNPDHLFLGTNKDNIHDAMIKHRVPQLTDPEKKPRGDRNGARTRPDRLPRGEQNSQARLTAVQVAEIRERCANGESQAVVARDYGITNSAIWRVVHRRNWKHVGGPDPKIDPRAVAEARTRTTKERHGEDFHSVSGSKGCAARWHNRQHPEQDTDELLRRVGLVR